MPRDHYEVLGVERTADETEIRKAFRRLARELHPDVNPAPEAEDRFKELAEAYEVLSDEDLRKKYDAGEDVTGNPGEGQQQQQQGHWMHHGGQHVHVQFR